MNLFRAYVMDVVLMPPLIPASTLALLAQNVFVVPDCPIGPLVVSCPSIVTQNLVAALTSLTNPTSGYPLVGTTADYRSVSQLIYAGQADVVLQSYTTPAANVSNLVSTATTNQPTGNTNQTIMGNTNQTIAGDASQVITGITSQTSSLIGVTKTLGL